MQICTIIGHVWATKKEEALEGKKLMIVKQTDGYGRSSQNECFVAADVVGAGIGEQVLVVNGSTARKALGSDDVPVDAVIVGIIDSLEVDQTEKRLF